MDKSLGHEFIEIINNLRKLTHKHQPSNKIHTGEFMMLGAIRGGIEDKRERHIEEPGIKVGELSELIHSTKPATSKMLKQVEEKGYIERVADKKDRRVVYIRLSDSGEIIMKDAMKRMGDFTNRTIKRLGEEDTKELIRLLKKFYQAFSEELNEKHTDNECHMK